MKKEIRYRRVDYGTDGLARPEEIRAVYTEQGQRLHLISPSPDIRRVENPGSKPSVSFHVYGGDMGVQKRRQYDPPTRAVE